MIDDMLAGIKQAGSLESSPRWTASELQDLDSHVDLNISDFSQ
jgi:hypothetical protein